MQDFYGLSWGIRPPILNNSPMPVTTKINVNFKLR
jgi:hypothetical protein